MRIAAIVAVVLGLASIATADPAQASIRKPTHIPPQPLVTALQKLSEERHIQLIYLSETIGALRTSGAVGELTADETIRALLSGTGLTYKYLDDNTITVQRHHSGKPDEPGASGTVQMPQPSARDPSTPSTDQRVPTDSLWDRLRLRLAQVDAAPTPAANNAESTQLEEIVVTAQKREERLQDVPISIGVLTGDDLDRSSARSIADSLSQLGGVSVIERAPGFTQIVLRGVVPDQSLGTATTGYYLDEIPFAFITKSHLPDTSAFDLSRVEVLRGPQGTLYGANALSGVVRVLTNDADLDDFEAKGRVRLSDTEDGGTNYGGDVALNLPLAAGVFAVRAVASYSDLSGFIDTAAGQRRFNDTQAHTYRLKANYQPFAALNVKLGVSGSKVDNGGPSYSYDDFTTPFSDNQADRRDIETYNLVADYQWSNVSLLSSSAYLDYKAHTQTEIEAFPGFYLNFLNGNELTSFSQEFRFSSQLAGPWQWSGGAFYKNTTEKLIQRAPAFFPFPLIEDQKSDSYAIFGEVTRSFAGGRFELTGGLRYFDERIVRTEISSFFGAPTTTPTSSDFDKVTGRAVFAYKPQASRTYYASVATGFRSGLNQNSAVAGTNPEFTAVDPDKLTNYELGAKGSLREGLVVYDAAVYYTDWKDIQQSLITSFGFVAGINAGSASGVGVDLGVAVHPTSALTLQTNVGWSGLELDDDVPFGTPPIVLFEGSERVNLSPEWTGSIGGSYRFATPLAGAHVVLSSNFTYRSSVTLRYLASGTLTPSESDVTRNLKAGLAWVGETYSVELFGDNLLDDREGIMPPDLTFAQTSIRQRPRTVGLQVLFNY